MNFSHQAPMVSPVEQAMRKKKNRKKCDNRTGKEKVPVEWQLNGGLK
jgi:hypothetical protein